MQCIDLLDPIQHGRPAKILERKLSHLTVGQDEAIRPIVKGYRPHVAAQAPVGWPTGDFLSLGPLFDEIEKASGTLWKLAPGVLDKATLDA